MAFIKSFTPGNSESTGERASPISPEAWRIEATKADEEKVKVHGRRQLRVGMRRLSRPRQQIHQKCQAGLLRFEDGYRVLRTHCDGYNESHGRPSLKSRKTKDLVWGDAKPTNEG